MSEPFDEKYWGPGGPDISRWGRGLVARGAQYKATGVTTDSAKNQRRTFSGGRKERARFHFDNAEIILDSEMQIEAPLCLDDFSRTNVPRRAGNGAANVRVVKIRREIQRLCEKAIAQEDAQRISPAGVDGRLRAPAFGFIHDVVVHEGGDVDQLDDHGQIEMRRGNSAAGATAQ